MERTSLLANQQEAKVKIVGESESTRKRVEVQEHGDDPTEGIVTYYTISEKNKQNLVSIF